MAKDTEITISDKHEVQAIVNKDDIFIKKKGVFGRLRDIFLADDIENVKEYAISDVIIPGLKNLIVDSVAMLVLGDGDYRRSSKKRDKDIDRVSYNTKFKYGDRERSRKRDNRDDDKINWDEIIFKTAASADDVLEGMYDLLREYEEVTLKDYYTLSNYKSSVFDDNYGWDTLKGVRIKRCRGGYILTLPEPMSLD